MEEFRGIAEESFPSFLTNSLLGNSGILENVTLSSNLGLPVAVSTLARNRPSSDNRYPDVQTSYLVDGGFSVPSESSPGCQSDTDPRGKLRLSFQDDDSMSRKKTCMESPPLSDALRKQLAFQSDASGAGGEAEGGPAPFQDQGPSDSGSLREQGPDSVDFRLQSWMNNQEHKGFVPDAGKYSEDQTPDSAFSHTSLLENEKLVSLTSLEDSSDDDINDEEFYDDHLEAYFEQLAIPGMLYEDVEGHESLGKDFKSPTSDPSQGSHSSGSSETTHKDSEEGHGICLPGTSNSVGTRDSRRHADGTLPFSSRTWRMEKERAESLKGVVPDHSRDSSREVLVTTFRASHETHSPALEGGFDVPDGVRPRAGAPCQSQRLAEDLEVTLHLSGGSDTETSAGCVQGSVGRAALTPASDKGMDAPDGSWSPTCARRTCAGYESIQKRQDQVDLPQNVIYQNDEGSWVTDLAYYTSFHNEQDLTMSAHGEVDEHFRSGSEALHLIAQDEEEFNREHQFIQEENIDAHDASAALRDTSWVATVNHNLLRRPLSTSDLDKDGASYLRLSLGEFFAQRSEALGCLGGDNGVKRPSFGYFIRSPEKREPVALIRKSDLSRSNLEKEMAHHNHHLFSGDLKELPPAPPSEGSLTLQGDALENTSQADESDATLTASTGRAEDTLWNGTLPQLKGQPQDRDDSVLRMSTIAMAIADASVSADPSQLAAMMKALAKKARDRPVQEGGEQARSALPHFLPIDLEKSHGSSVFDMEKYLTKTDISRHGGGLEDSSRAGLSDVWGLSLQGEQTTQDVHAADSCTTEMRTREPGESTAAAAHVENAESGCQESCSAINSSSVLTKRGENESAAVSMKTHPSDKSPDLGNSGGAASVSTPTPPRNSSGRDPRRTSPCLLEECEGVQDTRENERRNEHAGETGGRDKRVTFEKLWAVSPRDVESTSPAHGGPGSEDDQESFRPSTSPLSHSSPSEISGTSLSGCALESSDAAARHQKPRSESELSRSAHSRTDLSRLTYVSEQESTCPTTVADSGPENCKSDITSELSTTIIRASPTPSEGPAVDEMRGGVPVESRGKGALPYVIQNKPGRKSGTETTSLSSRPEGAADSASFQSRETLGARDGGWVSDPSELDLVGRCLLSRPGLSRAAGSPTPHRPESGQKSVDEGQRRTFQETSAASSASSDQIPNQGPSGSQHSPVAQVAVGGFAAEMPTVPATHPALWAGPSLGTAPLAPQYLGAVPATGNAALPQLHAGSTLACGLPGCCAYPAAAVRERVQNPVAAGLSGLLAPSSLCSSCSSAFHQNLLSAAQPFPVPAVGANLGVEPWDSGLTAGFGSARVPEELKFPHACCVGIASQTHLSVLNPTGRWLQVSVGLLSVSIDGEKVDLSAYPCLVFKNKVIIRPHASEEVKVLFIPSNPGVFRCLLRVASWPFSAAAETVVQAEALASRVVLTAVAETPVIEVETEKKGVLDFGDLTYGGWKALPLKLINRTHASVPVRLLINTDAFAWWCFTFSREPVGASLKAAPYADVVTQLAAPSVLSHVMPASYDGQDPEFLIIWVLFHSPKKLIASSAILDSPEEFLARVDIEVDSPNPTPVLGSVRLRARAGVARIHAPRDLQTVHLSASVNSSAKQRLPLKNAGNIEVYLDIKVPEQGHHFSVDPETLFLRPGEEHEVVVSFMPKDPNACEERILRIFVQPFGPQYEVVLKGEVISGSEPLPPGPGGSDLPLILSNKQFLTWGGVPLGRTQLQKLALRSSSTSTTQHLRLLIKGQDQDCFQLQNTFGSEERLTSNCEIKIHPKEDIVISILFAPTRLSCMLAKLEIKQLGNRSQPGIKFMIPLSGYGGTSNLILEGVKKLSDSYMVTVNGLVPGKESKIVFSVRNTGSRAAFVKAIGFKDSQRKVLLDPEVLRIFPDKFVLKERTQEDVTLIYNPSDRKNDYKTATELSTIYFFGGDEISRQQYRRALSSTPGIIRRMLPEHSVLQNVDFAEAFQDELLVDEVYDLPQRPNDIQLFYGNMRKIILSVIGEFRDSISSSEFLQSSSKASLESKSEVGASGKHSGNVSLDVLPVRGPQGSPFLSRAARPPQDSSASEEMWTVRPEHVILMAPSSCDMAKTGCFLIENNSVRLLKFELYWPAHCLTVTPQHGFIEPESKLQILVSPNSSLSTKQSMFPWSGLIYIHCDNGQKKVVKVQIREDLTQKDLLPGLTSGLFGELAPATEPSLSHLVKPVTRPPSTKVEIRSKTVTFPTTEPGKTSESCLELENHGPADVKWHLSSFAPPYVKGVDESGDVFRATYAAFRCSPLSGTLESHGLQKVSITFLPRDRGDYAQFWDVECHPVQEPHRTHTLRVQLSGHSIRAESEADSTRPSTDALVKLDAVAKPRRHAAPEASALLPRQLDLSPRGVHAPEDVYMFLPTRVGESRMLKVNLRNNSFITHSLKFLSPREPFYIKHSKYSLRARHYIHIPVYFRPKSVGRFEALLVIQTDEGKSVAVRLIGEALEKN